MKIAVCVVVLSLLAPPLSYGADPNTPEANIAVIKAQIAQQNRGDWAGSLTLYTDQTRNFGRPVGRAVMSKIFEDIWRTFPDWHVEVRDITAIGDSVIVREKTSGTHDGVGRIPVNGGMLVDVKPTHRHFVVDQIHWFKLRGGKIIDHYATRDDLSMLQQLGLSPAPRAFDWARFAAEANGH